MSESFPRTAAELSNTWLTRVLIDAGVLRADDTVSTFSVEPLGAGFAAPVDPPAVAR